MLTSGDAVRYPGRRSSEISFLFLFPPLFFFSVFLYLPPPREGNGISDSIIYKVNSEPTVYIYEAQQRLE